MNLLKSVYIVVFIAWLAVFGLYGLVQLARGMTPALSWLGLVLGTLGPLAYIIRSYLLKPPRTPGPALAYTILCGLGLAMTMAMSFRHGPTAGITHAWTGVTLIAWLAWLRWFSREQEK